MDRWCSPVNTSPCHGEDRGFESRPVRQKNNLNTSGCFSVYGPEASHLRGLRRDENAGAMFDEHSGEPNSEAVARPRRRKPTRAAAESRPVRQKNNLNTSGCFSVYGPEASHLRGLRRDLNILSLPGSEILTNSRYFDNFNFWRLRSLGGVYPERRQATAFDKLRQYLPESKGSG